MAEPGSLTLGIPSRKHLWAAQAKVYGAIVTMTQRKRLRRWSQKAQDKAPAAEPTDRYALPQKPGGKHRPTDAKHGNWERHNLIRALLLNGRRCQPDGVSGGIPQEAKAEGNTSDRLTCGR